MRAAFGPRGRRHGHPCGELGEDPFATLEEPGHARAIRPRRAERVGKSGCCWGMRMTFVSFYYQK